MRLKRAWNQGPATGDCYIAQLQRGQASKLPLQTRLQNYSFMSMVRTLGNHLGNCNNRQSTEVLAQDVWGGGVREALYFSQLS